MTDFDVNFAVAEVVPHEAPMILIDRLVAANKDSLVAEVDIQAQAPFFQPDVGVPAWIGIEYMAQAIAAWAGVIGRQKGQAAKLGFLLGSRKYSASQDYFSPGSTLTIRINKIYQEQELGVFECSICDHQEIAVANINVFQP